MTGKIYTTLQIDTPTKRQKIKTWIDTGFDKYLILPEQIAEKIRLKIVKRVPVGLGNSKFSYGAVGEAILSMSIAGLLVEIEAEILVLPHEVEPIMGIGLLALIYEKTGHSPLLDFKTGQVVFLAI
jgi:predicted aspartyl protease